MIFYVGLLAERRILPRLDNKANKVVSKALKEKGSAKAKAVPINANEFISIGVLISRTCRCDT